jgi:circadian clock protein KaiC
VVVDSLKDFVIGDNEIEVKSMILRLVDFLKAQEITSIFTSLTPGRSNIERTEIGLSSLIDTWLLVRDIELGGERNRGLYILKSRGMSHSNQIREFKITDNGIQLSNVYLGVGNTLTGTARVVQEAREKATTLVQEQDRTRLQIYLDNMRKKLDAQITAIRSDFAAQEAEMMKIISQDQQRELQLVKDREARGVLRKKDPNNNKEPKEDKK